MNQENENYVLVSNEQANQIYKKVHEDFKDGSLCDLRESVLDAVESRRQIVTGRTSH